MGQILVRIFCLVRDREFGANRNSVRKSVPRSQRTNFRPKSVPRTKIRTGPGHRYGKVAHGWNIEKPDKGLSSIVNRLKFWKNKPAKTASISEGDDAEDTDVAAIRKEITSGQS